ncbi:MAG TPA: hypothetical protein PK878_11655 [bacterium]|nr:hypothetical protein [Candidatus Omnitrophota bacterium]HOJ60934.1 hypothetical protein [bacterium]HOL93621.1 hypothetical protein [bacterium]HPP00092.1 hypothetical protein [bacterium]HXK94028.1 hypothetical protein [bacterium]
MHKTIARHLFFILLSFLATPAFAQDRNADVPVITSILEQRDGSRVAIQFRAIHWDPELLVDLQTNPELRDDFNQNVLPFLSRLETNVKLRIGKYVIEPGAYHVGFLFNDDGSWTFLAADDQRNWVEISLPMRQEENTVPFLSYVFTPGITERDFILSFLYGHLSTALRVTMTGFPQQVVGGAEESGEISPWEVPDTPSPVGDLMEDQGEGKTRPATLFSPMEKTIMEVQKLSRNGQSITPNCSTPPVKAGSGAFRYLLEYQKKKENP